MAHSVCSKCPAEGYARAAATVLIPQCSETNVLVNVSNIKNGANVLLEPNPLLSNNKHLTTAQCLVQVENGKAMLRILNPTHSDIQLHAREMLANVIQIEEPNIFAMETPSSTYSGNGTSTLNIDLSNSELTPAQKKTLLEFLQDSFASDLCELGRTAEYRHKIETIPGARPVLLPYYRTTP